MIGCVVGTPGPQHHVDLGLRLGMPMAGCEVHGMSAPLVVDESGDMLEGRPAAWAILGPDAALGDSELAHAAEV